MDFDETPQPLLFPESVRDGEGNVIAKSWAWVMTRYILGPCEKDPETATEKLVMWIGDLRNDGRIELDEIDFKGLRNIVDKARMGVIVRGQILRMMADAKENSE